MPISWGTALNTQQDDFAHMLAQNDVSNQRLLQITQQAEGMRQNRAEEALRQQQIEEQAKARAESTAQRVSAQKTLDEERTARAGDLADKSAREKAIKDEQDRILLDPNADPQLKKTIQYFRSTGKLPTADIQTGRDRDAEMNKRIDAASDRQQRSFDNAVQLLIKGHDLRQADTDKKVHADNPHLPEGVQTYLMSLPAKKDEQGQPFTLIRARQEIQQVWPKLVAAHPNLSLKDVGGALNSLFTQPNPDREVTYEEPAQEGAVKPIPGVTGAEATFQKDPKTGQMKWIRTK